MINFAKEDDYIKVNRVEQQFIKKNHPLYDIVDRHCFYSKNVYNQANYIIRQAFINEEKVLTAFDVQHIMKDNIVVKFGRFIPGHKKHYDEVLGVELASDNQYAEVIS